MYLTFWSRVASLRTLSSLMLLALATLLGAKDLMAQALKITNTSLAAGTVGLQYSDTLTATGPSTAKKWDVISGSLPAGLKLDADSGEIKGKPDVAGTSNFKVRVSTTAARVTLTDEKDFTITVNPPLATW